MQEIKIIVNPYKKAIKYQSKDDRGDWKDITSPSSDFSTTKYLSYDEIWSENAKAIVENIYKLYGERTEIVFEGTDFDYNKLKSIVSADYSDVLNLKKSNFRFLESPDVILNNVKKLFDEAGDLFRDFKDGVLRPASSSKNIEDLYDECRDVSRIFDSAIKKIDGKIAKVEQEKIERLEKLDKELLHVLNEYFMNQCWEEYVENYKKFLYDFSYISNFNEIAVVEKSYLQDLINNRMIIIRDVVISDIRQKANDAIKTVQDEKVLASKNALEQTIGGFKDGIKSIITKYDFLPKEEISKLVGRIPMFPVDFSEMDVYNIDELEFENAVFEKLPMLPKIDDFDIKDINKGYKDFLWKLNRNLDEKIQSIHKRDFENWKDKILGELKVIIRSDDIKPKFHLSNRDSYEYSEEIERLKNLKDKLIEEKKNISNIMEFKCD